MSTRLYWCRDQIWTSKLLYSRHLASNIRTSNRNIPMMILYHLWHTMPLMTKVLQIYDVYFYLDAYLWRQAQRAELRRTNWKSRTNVDRSYHGRHNVKNCLNFTPVLRNQSRLAMSQMRSHWGILMREWSLFMAGLGWQMGGGNQVLTSWVGGSRKVSSREKGFQSSLINKQYIAVKFQNHVGIQ